MVKSATRVIADLNKFIPKAKEAIEQLEEMKRRLETDEGFRKLWEADSGRALRGVGIKPNARMKMGLPPYSKGPRCDWCITPNGNSCHC
jgi:hypothetical protein